MVKGGSRKKAGSSGAGGHGKGSGENKKGLWTTEEDTLLMEYVKVHGKGKWNRIPHLTGLKRCGKSCRLRWMNYLSPNIKRGDFSQEEDDLIIRLHKLLGNRWSLIAGRVPGRTDNQVKNYWNTHLSKKLGVKKAKEPSGRGTVEELKCVEDGTARSSKEILRKEELPLTEKQNIQSPFTYATEDDNLIINPQSLMDFLNEYSLDYTWNNIL